MSEKVFAKGLYAKSKNEKAPAFVKGSLSIKVEDFITFLNEHKNDAGYVNLDLLENKTDPSKWNATSTILSLMLPRTKKIIHSK